MIIPFLTLPASAETVTILAFGDSLIQGYGLPAENGFVPQLEAWLTEQGEDVTIVNGGVSGDTTAGGAARIAWSLTDEIDAVIVALGGNDLLRGLPVETAKANLDTILTEIRNRELPALVVGQVATGNYGADYKVAFDGMYGALAEAHGAQLYPYMFSGIGAAIEAGDAARTDLFQPDGIHPNAEGVRLNVAEIGPAVQALIDEVSGSGM